MAAERWICTSDPFLKEGEGCGYEALSRPLTDEGAPHSCPACGGQCWRPVEPLTFGEFLKTV